jgi:putative ABC transport system permease protein
VSGIAALDRKVLRGLWRIRGQAVAIALVAASGVAMFVMAAGTFSSLTETRAAYYERHRMPDVFATAKRAPEEIAARLAELPGVAAVSSRVAGVATVDITGVVELVQARLVSWDPSRPEALGRPYLRAGRMIAPGGIDEILVAESFAIANNLSPGDKLPLTVNGQRRNGEIVGVVLAPEFIYSIAPGTIMPDARRYGVIWMSRNSLAAAYDMDGAFNEIVLSLLPGTDVRVVLEGVDSVLDRFGGTGAYDRTDHMSDAFLSAEIDGLEAMGKVVPPIFLAVAALLINIVMSRLVQTEREQIGLFKAFGYSNRRIAAHYLKIASAITGIGAIVGVLGGAWLGRAITEIYGDFFTFPFLLFRPDPSTIVFAAVVSVVAGGIGTLYAINKAIKLAPAEAMVPPAPPRYRHFASPSWIGTGFSNLAAKVPQPTRMIGRHLARGWSRAMVTAMGVALAVAMLVSTLFFLDAIEVILDVQFQVGSRQDASVTFIGTRARDAVWRLEDLPGVIAAEGYRAVPAEISSLHHHRNVAITGLPENPQLQRPLDRNLRPVAIPEHGILLSAKLAELLGVGTGGWVHIDVKEGARPTLSLQVTALADDYIGTSAYMNISALNRALGESALVNGANLLVDPTLESEFFSTTKDLPAVAGVQSQHVALQMFRDTLAENLYISIFFYIAFAAVIAVGVVYNSARISLSERARELATLRVLGFSRGEVSYILLGELAVLAVAAMPLGCGLGYVFASGIIELYRTDLMRMPLVVNASTYALSMLIVLVVTALSGFAVRRQIDRLDLVAVLKTRE